MYFLSCIASYIKGKGRGKTSIAPSKFYIEIRMFHNYEIFFMKC